MKTPTKIFSVPVIMGVSIWAILGFVIWGACHAAHAATPTPAPLPAWQGFSVEGCTVANVRSYPEAKDQIPGNPTYMSGVIISNPGKGTYGVIEVWPDNSDVEYKCNWLPLNKAVPVPSTKWVWATWPNTSIYADYTMPNVTFTPYSDPAGVPVSSVGGGPDPCQYKPLTYAQTQSIQNHYCFRDSYNDQQNGWTDYDWSDHSCVIFFGLYQHNPYGYNCILLFGDTSIKVCPDGNWTAGNTCSTI